MTLLMAHRCGEELGFGDNSKKSIEESLKNNFDIIEVDIRKSKDGVLYCYHGNFWEVTLYKFLLKTKNIEELKKEKNIITLEEAFDIIKDKAYIFLDLKEYDILEKDLENIIKNVKVKGIYISGILSIKTLLKFKTLKKIYPKIYLVNINFNPFRVDFNKIFNLGIDVIQILHWNINQKSKEFKNKISITPMFISKKKYKNKLLEGQELHYIHTDYI